MSAIIIKTKDGQSYKLEYTRASFLRTMQRLRKNGVDSMEQLSDPIIAVTVFPDLFEGAFIANHADVDSETIAEILKNVKNKKEMSETLATMFFTPVQSLMESLEEENPEGNVSWEVSE